MCKYFKSLLIDVTNRIKIWSIKKQMMLCYSFGMFIIITVVICTMILNVLLLQQRTVDEVDSTRDDQANEDLLNLAKVGSQFVYSEIYGGALSMHYLQYMLINMFQNESFSLDSSSQLYEFKDLSPADTVSKPNYGDIKICFKYPTYFYLDPSAEDTLDLKQKVSTFMFFFEDMFKIFNYSIFRYTLYFEQSEFVLFYPGTNITKYDPKKTVWYQDFIKTGNTTTTGSYIDSLNSNNLIVSIVIPLYSDTKMTQRIGVICGDWLVKDLYELMTNNLYLGTGYQYLVYHNGSLLETPNNQWLDPKITNLNNLTYFEYWDEVLSEPTGIHYLIEDGDIWRTASAAVNGNLTDNKADWGFVLILMLKESDVMSCKWDAKNLINDEGMKFVVVTVVCSVVAASVILVMINIEANRISRPIQGIIDFTYKLNTETDEDVRNIESELHQLEEGKGQTAKLVLAYKELARSLINRRNVYSRQEDQEPKEYPPNELYRIDKALLLRNLELIPTFYNTSK